MPTSRTTQASLRHIRRVEAAVNRYAPLLWRATAPHLRRWLRAALETARPALQALVLEARAYEAEKLYLAALLQGLDLPPPDAGRIARQLAEDLALQFGFLLTDPRRDVILDYTTRILEDDVSSYWRSLTDPEQLARRLVTLKAEGLSYTELSRRIADEYRSSFYRAERLVRSTYNSSANHANYQDLLEVGVEQHRWLTARDARVRRPRRGSGANHRAMDGQVVRVGEAFVTPRGYRLRFPGDRSLGAPIDEVINCRCVTVP